MTIKKKAFAAAVILLLATALLLFATCETIAPPKVTQTPAVLAEENTAFSDAEQQAMLDEIRALTADIEILDYSFGKKDTFVHAVAVCRDLNSGLETGVACLTELGPGYVVLASDAPSLKYYKESGLKLDSSDTARLSFSDTATGKICDYGITFSKADDAMLSINAFNKTDK